jgi:hypothetical protein
MKSLFSFVTVMIYALVCFGQNENAKPLKQDRDSVLTSVKPIPEIPIVISVSNLDAVSKRDFPGQSTAIHSLEKILNDFGFDEQKQTSFLLSPPCSQPGTFSLNSPGAFNPSCGYCVSDVYNYTDMLIFNWGASSGAVGYDLQVSQYPYGTATSTTPLCSPACGFSNNFVAEAQCLPTNTPVYFNNNFLVPGMFYRWNVNAFSDCNITTCKRNSSNILYFQTKPVITAVGSATICPSGNGNVEIKPIVPLSVNPPGVINYQWFKNSIQVYFGPNASYFATSPGTYTLKISYSGGPCCANSQPTTVASNEIIVTQLGGFSLNSPGTFNNLCGYCTSEVHDYTETLTFNWGQSSGAVGYDLQVSKYPYGTATTTSPVCQPACGFPDINIVKRINCVNLPTNSPIPLLERVHIYRRMNRS